MNWPDFKRLPVSKVVGDLFVTFSRREFLAYRLPGEKENLVPWDAAEVGPTASACREIPNPYIKPSTDSVNFCDSIPNHLHPTILHRLF